MNRKWQAKITQKPLSTKIKIELSENKLKKI